MTIEDTAGVINQHRNVTDDTMDKYISDNFKNFGEFETDDDVTNDFDEWEEQNELAFQKIQDANYYSSL